MDQAGAESILKQATEALGRGDSRAAREMLEPLTGPSAPVPALFLLAQACRADGDPEAELAAIDRLLALHPGHLGGLLMKGAALSRSGDDDGAMAPYQMALSVAEQARRGGHLLPPMLASRSSASGAPSVRARSDHLRASARSWIAPCNLTPRRSSSEGS